MSGMGKDTWAGGSTSLSKMTPEGYLRWGFLCVLCVLLAVQLGQCLHKYLEHPTYVSYGINMQNQTEFPAVTMCPQFGYKDDVAEVDSMKFTFWRKVN